MSSTFENGTVSLNQRRPVMNGGVDSGMFPVSFRDYLSIYMYWLIVCLFFFLSFQFFGQPVLLEGLHKFWGKSLNKRLRYRNRQSDVRGADIDFLIGQLAFNRLCLLAHGWLVS